MNLEVDTKVGKDIVVLYLKGNMDLDLASKFEEEITKVISHHPDLHILINMKDLDFIDSSCLRVIITAKRELSSNRKQLSISNSNSIIQKVFELTKMQKVVNIYETEEEALRALQITV